MPHSTLSPSAAHRWVKCPGSVALEAKAPKPRPSEHAAEGTVAHDLAEKYASGKLDSLELMGKVGEIVKQDGYEIEITDEMVDGAIEYGDAVEADRKMLLNDDRPAHVQVQFEKRVTAKSIDPDVWGTADSLVYRKGHKLIVRDYKFGKGVQVDVEENEQLCVYAVGAMDDLDCWAFEEIEIVIHQPRGEHADGAERRWSADRAWFEEFRDRMKKAVAEARKPDAQLESGAWCRWCKGQAFCSERHALVQAKAQVTFSAIPDEKALEARLPEVKLLPVEQLTAALKWKDQVEAFFKAVQAAILERLESGEKVSGWKLVSGRANRKWISEEAVVTRYSPLYGDSIYEPRKLLSPSKLEKVVGKKKLDSDLWTKPAAPKTLASEDDPRRPVATSAQETFADPLPGVPAVMQTVVVPEGHTPQSEDLLAELQGEEAPPKKKLWA